MKCKQYHPGLGLVSPIPFPMVVTYVYVHGCAYSCIKRISKKVRGRQILIADEIERE